MLNRIRASDIAIFLKLELIGRDITVKKPVSIKKLDNETISFINNKNMSFNCFKCALIIVPEDFIVDNNSYATYIRSNNPKLNFIKILNKFFYRKSHAKIANTAKIGNNCKIGNNVFIGEYTIIGDNVVIDDNTIIKNHIVIESNTIIGKNCYIKSGAIIGEDGFGFSRDKDNVPIRFPHIGNVIIGDNVEIGSNSTIARGALDSTIIKDNVKINDQVHIAHNCIIGDNVMIASHACISGSVSIGNNCWLSTNVSIKDGIKVGNNCFLGIGSILTKDLADNSKIVSFVDLTLKNVAKIRRWFKK